MGIFGNYFDPLASVFATAQIPQTPGAFPNPSPSPPPPGSQALPSPPPSTLPLPPAPAAASPAPPFGGWDSLGQSINNGLTNHALTLMGLGAGIAQGGVGRGLALAGTAAEAERRLLAQQVNFRQTFDALAGAGVPRDEALAAVVNPSLMRALAVKYLGPRAPGNGTSAPSVPAAPHGIPEGSAFTPASWKAPDGTVFDEAGRPVK